MLRALSTDTHLPVAATDSGDGPHAVAGESPQAKRWSDIQAIFDEASDLPPHQQAHFVSRVCLHDSELCAEVLSLLEWHRSAQSIFDSALFRLAPEELDNLLPSGLTGKRIGSYRVIRELSSGGMGTVYAAERADGEFEQTVALKVISSVLPTDTLLRRFHAERQMLARLHHPHIGLLLDGGTTADGQPYLVMEYIEGKDICTYADEHRLDEGGRIRLFLKVCSAVQAAHQALIVHCDLKPGNILVTPDGFPKLLDFGVANALAGALKSVSENGPDELSPNPAAPLIASSGLALTPAYASPEQLSGGMVTTASDVYSLGVLLCVLLSGLSPFESRKERMAVAPGLRLASAEGREKIEALARVRGVTPRAHLRRMRGDLDAIVLRALAENPAHRYGSVEQMAADLRAHLDLRPVSALAGSRRYRVSKFCARHRIGVVAAFALLAVLLAGTVGILWQARAAERERAKAVRRFNDVRQIAYSVLFELSAAIQNLQGSTAAQALLAKRANAFLSGMAQDAPDDPAFMRELAGSYRKLGTMQGLPLTPNIGDTRGALASFENAVYWGERARSRNPLDVDGAKELAKAYDGLALVENDLGRELQYSRKAIELDEALLRDHPERDDIADALSIDYQHASTPLHVSGQPDAALAILAKSFALSDRIVQQHPENKAYKATLSFTCKKIGGLLIKKERWDEALAAYLKSLSLDEQRSRGAGHDPRTQYDATFAYDDIGYIFWHRGDPDRGLAWYTKSLAIRKAAAEQDPTNRRSLGGVATVEAYMGKLNAEANRWPEALAHELEANAIRERLASEPTAGTSQQLELFETEFYLARTYAGWARTTHRRFAARQASEWADRAQRLGARLLDSKEIGTAQAQTLRDQLEQIRTNPPLRF